MQKPTVAYVGIRLTLVCPAPVGGRTVSTLIRVGEDINYQVEGSGVPEQPWPPDPPAVDYGERCSCPTCEGRLVGAPIEELRDVISALQADLAVNQDTYLDLRYIESARDFIIREVQRQRYTIQRDLPTFTDRYVKTSRTVSVRYDGSFQGEVAEVTVEPSGGPYPNTITGAVAALRGTST